MIKIQVFFEKIVLKFWIILYVIRHSRKTEITNIKALNLNFGPSFILDEIFYFRFDSTETVIINIKTLNQV